MQPVFLKKKYICIYTYMSVCFPVKDLITLDLYKENESKVAWSNSLRPPWTVANQDSSLHGIFQARVLDWVAIFFSRESSQSRDRSQVSCIRGRCFTVWATREAPHKRMLKFSTWTVNFQMFKLILEKAEEPEIKLPIFDGSSKKQKSSRKTSSSALLTLPKPLTVWITINCGKFWKRWEYQTTWPASWETCMQVRKQQLELNIEWQTGSK